MRKTESAVQRCKTMSTLQKILGGKWKLEILYYIAFHDIHRFGGLGGQQGRTGAGQDEESVHKQAAANYIRSGHYREAINVLNGIKNRDAHWYYLSAIANSGSGNNVTALEHAKRAVSMEPGNMQYRRLLQQLEGGGSWYGSQRQFYGGAGNGSSTVCRNLCVTYLLCNMCGGGLCCGRGIPYY